MQKCTYFLCFNKKKKINRDIHKYAQVRVLTLLFNKIDQVENLEVLMIVFIFYKKIK